MGVLQLKRAQRSNIWLKLGMSAPSGGGKTAGSLLVAYGLMKEAYPQMSEPELWEKIAIIDTENGSGELYVGSEIGGTLIGAYGAITLESPYTAEKYIEALNLCETNGIEVAIIDSTTHLWSGEGGLLEQQANAAKRSGNSYTAWRDITPMHAKFVDTMLLSKMHIIATMRAKQEYVQEKNDQGKTTVKKLGMEPEQRKGMEYEFTTFFEVDSEHKAFGAKDRTSIFDQQTFKITPEVGKKLMKWLKGADVSVATVRATSHVAEKAVAEKTIKAQIVDLAVALKVRENPPVMETIKKYTPDGGLNTNGITDETKLVALKTELEDMLAKQEASVEA